MNLNDPTLLVERCFVGGAWIGEPAEPIDNPATGEILAHVPRFGAAEATQAVEAAAEAFKGWSRRTAKERSGILRRWFELILANKEDLALIMTSEQGKPLAEARGEVEYAASFVEFYAEEAKRIYGETIPSHRADARIIVTRQPVGVVAAITPWNFPAAMITRKVSPALAAGCTAVIKPAPETPLTALALGLLAERAGMPAGVLNLVTGDAKAIGEVMTSHPAVRFVGFTGSTEVGKLLMRQAAATVKKVGLELGGNAPFIVFDDADVDAAVEGAMISKFRNMGQTCVCANRIYAQDAIYDEFVGKLAGKVGALKVGNGVEVGVMQGPLIKAQAIEKVERHVADAVGQGARVMVGGGRHALGRTFFEPTVLANVTTTMLITREETFGPVAPVYRFTDEADVIAQANATPFGLASYFYARDLGRVFRVAEALEYGIVGVNTGLIATEVAPFGGIKESGIGREGSHHGIDEFVELKYMLLAGLDRVTSDPLKRAAAARAVELVSDGMRLGLGTGSTAALFVALLGERVRGGLKLVGVPTSEATRALAERSGISLTTLDEAPELDLTVDGADEIDGALRLIKGGGGALLREKIVAAASRRMIVIADGPKRVEILGRFPLPIEVAPFGLGATRRALAAILEQAGLPAEPRLRRTLTGDPYLTDGGHLILDAPLGRIDEPEALAQTLDAVPGVMAHGLFIGLATGVVLATESGLVELGRVGP